MSISSLASLCLVELLNNAELCLLVAGYHHLRNAFAFGYDKGLVGKVDKQHTQFATVVGIDSSW